LSRVVIAELLAPLLLLGLGQQQPATQSNLGGGPEDAAAFLYWLMHQPQQPTRRFKPGRMDVPWKKQRLKRTQALKLIKMMQALQQARLFSAYKLS
jgi:hypothetical protein